MKVLLSIAVLAIFGDPVATTGYVPVQRIAGSNSQPLDTPGQLRGIVIDERTQRPVIVARIRILELERQVYTDSSGRYRIDSVTAKKFSVQADAVGYLREIREVELPYPPHTVCQVPCQPWRPVEELNFFMRLRPVPAS